jgi:hypothetical protein
MVGGGCDFSKIPTDYKKKFETIKIMSKGSFTKGPGVLAPGFGANDNCIGPELTFGAKLLGKFPSFNMIKIAYIGTSLYTSWRSPSSGKVGPLYTKFIEGV